MHVFFVFCLLPRLCFARRGPGEAGRFFISSHVVLGGVQAAKAVMLRTPSPSPRSVV